MNPRFLLFAFFALAVPAHASPAEWPEGWRKAYERFENFTANQRRLWPASDLTILPDGSVQHGIRLTETRTEHISIEIFRDGASILTTSDETRIFPASAGSKFPNGTHTAAIKTTGTLGYQYAFPIHRFEIRGDSLAPPPAPPTRPDAVWPNERALAFFNFHVAPHRNPNDVREANEKVSPALVLRVDQSGTVHRDLLADDAAENALHWRVYHQGQLVADESAAGVPTKRMTHGFGTYQVLLGIEGPTGFMPVGNFLEFPLFPEADGSLAVRPTMSPTDRLPEFLDGIARIGDDGRADADSDDDGLTNAEEGYIPLVVDPRTASDLEKSALLRLWRSWQYDVVHRFAADPDHPGFIKLR